MREEGEGDIFLTEIESDEVHGNYTVWVEESSGPDSDLVKYHENLSWKMVNGVRNWYIE